MNWITWGVLALAGVAAALVVSFRQNAPDEDVWHPEATPQQPEGPEEEPDEEEEDLPEIEPTESPARVVGNCREMNPLALQAASRVTFQTEAGDEYTALIPGEGGLHLLEGDTGLLTMRGDVFVSFEKPDGEVVGALYYVPAGGGDALSDAQMDDMDGETDL